MKKLFLVVFLCSAFLFIGNTASAMPLLQLDIGSGVYDSATETIVASSDNFTLYALLTPNGKKTFEDYGGEYNISIAILPQTGTASFSGSFTFGGSTYTSGNFGAGGPSGLPSHGVFDTAWMEVPFQFDKNNTVGTYNTQDNPGGFGSFPGDGTYYAAFDVDTSLLDPNIILHFDLYNYGSPEVDKFAPFSHDASSSPVPEPATMLLLGGGLVGLAGFGRKRFKK